MDVIGERGTEPWSYGGRGLLKEDKKGETEKGEVRVGWGGKRCRFLQIFHFWNLLMKKILL